MINTLSRRFGPAAQAADAGKNRAVRSNDLDLPLKWNPLPLQIGDYQRHPLISFSIALFVVYYSHISPETEPPERICIRRAEGAGPRPSFLQTGRYSVRDSITKKQRDAKLSSAIRQNPRFIAFPPGRHPLCAQQMVPPSPLVSLRAKAPAKKVHHNRRKQHYLSETGYFLCAGRPP